MATTFTVPAPTRELTSNLFGLAGVGGLAVAVGGLAGWWWCLAFVSLVLVGLSWVGQHELARRAAAPAVEPAAASTSAPPAPAGASAAPVGRPVGG